MRNRRRTWFARFVVSIVLLTAPLGLATSQQPLENPWKFDILHLKNGRQVPGLLVEDGPKVKIWRINRAPGSPATRIYLTFDASEVARIDRLDDEQRKILTERVNALAPGHEADQMKKVSLMPVPWGKGDKKGLQYRSDYFVLSSNAPEETVRRAAVRLQQAYLAYTRFLPARRPVAQPTTVRLFDSMAEFRTQRPAGAPAILNPAYYDSRQNEIVCASDLRQLHEALEKSRKLNAENAKRTEAQIRDLQKGPKDEVTRKMLESAIEHRKKIEAAIHENDRKFEQATRRLFQTLYHEAFHAYLANFVYPPGQDAVPRWLNEGLAQVFETAVLEAGEFRVGHAPEDRLLRIQAKERKGQMLPLADLLRSEAKQFLVAHANEQEVSDQYYLTSWALAYYLTFDLEVLGTPQLDLYVRSLKLGAEPVEAFSKLVGKPIEKCEAAFHHYIRRLRPSGMVAMPTPGGTI